MRAGRQFLPSPSSGCSAMNGAEAIEIGREALLTVLIVPGR